MMSKNPKMVICRNCNTAIPKKAKICPSCGAKNKKPFYKKAWFIILVIIAVIGVIGSIGGKHDGSNKSNEVDKTEEYKWPDSELGRMIPQPDSPYGKVSFENEDGFWIDVYNISDEQFENYIEECKDCGFTVDYNKFDGFYSAEDVNGYSLSLTYNEDKETLSISMNAPVEEPESTDNENVADAEQETPSQEEPNSEETTPSIDEEQDTSESTNSDSQELVDGMRPEFKEAMDSYEAFYDEYCDFMKKYAENSTDLKLIAEYADMVSELAEMDKKFQAWDEGEMNDAELKYYLEVNTRVTQKLLEVAE